MTKFDISASAIPITEIESFVPKEPVLKKVIE